MGPNWKCPFSPFTYPIAYKVGFWYFRSLFIRDTVSNKTYQNFCDKRFVRPGSNYSTWQRSQPISYKAKFSQRDNIYLVDLKYSITYQNIQRRKLRSDRFLCHQMAKMTKKLPYNLHRWASYKIAKFVLTQKRLPVTYYNFHYKSLVRPKSKSPIWQGSQAISYKTKFSQRDSIHLVDLKCKITYQNIQGRTKFRPIFMPWEA